MTSTLKRRRGASSSCGDNHIRTIISLVLFIGGAFLLAIIILASRLGEVAEEGNGGIATKTTKASDTAEVADLLLAHQPEYNSLLRGGGGGDEIDGDDVASSSRRLHFPPLPPHLMAEEIYGESVIDGQRSNHGGTRGGDAALPRKSRAIADRQS
jgi:hypothetical protein